jgi:hypothetical protein
VSRRPLVFVFGLTFGDYLLWSWSVNGNHDVLSLVSGLTLPPLAVVCAWLLTLSVARLLGHVASRPAMRLGVWRSRKGHERRSGTSVVASGGNRSSADPAGAAETPTHKLAA